MKKTKSFKKAKMKRFFAVVFALVMVLSGISVPAVKVEADTVVNYKSILGDARYYGVLANEFHQKNHMQTNYAVVTFYNPAGDKGGAIPNEPDLVQGNNIPFCAAHIPEGNWVRFGNSTYYRNCNMSDPTSSDPKYLFDTQSDEGNYERISCDTDDVYLDIVEAGTIETKVKAMIAHIQGQSNSLWGNDGRTYSAEEIGDTNQFTLDVSGFEEVVYIKVTQPSGLYEAINKKGLTIKKKAEQVVVFNVEGTDVRLDKFTVEVVGSDGSTIVKNNTEANSGVGEKNDFLRDYVDEKIVWNLHDAETVEIHSGAGIFLIPKAVAKTNIAESSTGWLATAGDVENPNAEWHFPHRIIYQPGDIIPEGEDPYVRPSDPDGDNPSPYRGTYKISKKDLTTLSELPGATLALYEGAYPKGVPQGTLKDRWVSTSTPHEFSWMFSDDNPHYYTLYEEAAPGGYKVATNITFCIEKGVLKASNAYSVVKKTGTMDATITMADQAIANVKISKKSLVDGEAGNELAGATLKLYEKNSSTVVETWTSGGTPKEISGGKLKLETTYVLEETAAPDGYAIASTIEFTIDASGKVTGIKSNATGDEKAKVEQNSNGSERLIVMLDAVKTQSSDPGKEDPEKDPDGGIKNPDGTITYPDGSVKYPDGTITYPDGSVKNPDGSVTYPGGTITYPDGSVKNPDGSVTYPDGTITYPDGSKKNPDGSVTYPDGTITYPDGSKKNPDGSTTTPTGTTKHPDGTVSHPDGSTTKPDGTFVDSDGTVYAPDPANPLNPDAEYAYDNDRVPTPDISSSDEDDEDFMKEVKSKSSNKKDQKNADKALKNAATIKTGDNSSVFAEEKKVIQTKLGAKNTSKISKKMNSSLKKYRKIHKKQAKQIAGWVKINGTNVNYPVMYSGLKHNDKYLHKNIYGKEDNHGMIFASYLTTSRKISYNYIIYGHNMKDETMFGNLDNYGSPSFAKSHKYINVDTSKYNYVYEVVDVVRVSCAAGSKDKMIYEKFAQINKKKVYKSWKKQVAKCRDKNYKKPLGKYTNKDRLVILSTCEYTKENGRLGLICKQKKCVKVK